MTYGPVHQWKFPFQKKINVKSPDVRIFLLLCTVGIFLLAIWVSYCGLRPADIAIKKTDSETNPKFDKLNGRFENSGVIVESEIRAEFHSYNKSDPVDEVEDEISESAIIDNARGGFEINIDEKINEVEDLDETEDGEDGFIDEKINEVEDHDETEDGEDGFIDEKINEVEDLDETEDGEDGLNVTDFDFEDGTKGEQRVDDLIKETDAQNEENKIEKVIDGIERGTNIENNENPNLNGENDDADNQKQNVENDEITNLNEENGDTDNQELNVENEEHLNKIVENVEELGNGIEVEDNADSELDNNDKGIDADYHDVEPDLDDYEESNELLVKTSDGPEYVASPASKTDGQTEYTANPSAKTDGQTDGPTNEEGPEVKGDAQTSNSSASGQQMIDWNDPRLDIIHQRPPVFESHCKNPCWREPLTSPHVYTNNTYVSFSPSAKRTLEALDAHWTKQFDQQTNPTRLRCLPYFLIIGQPKCGSTDLFWKVAKHPNIATPPIKELHWWSRTRQGRRFGYKQIIPLEDYVDMFDKAGLQIEQQINDTSLNSAIEASDQIIVGEASVSLFWDNYEWQKFPENEGQSEPKYVVADYVHHIIPDVRLILILRDPVERMYSDYLYFHSTNKSAEDFHGAVKFATELYTSCISEHSARYCVYSNAVASKTKVRLRVGIYSVYMRDWLRLFPRSQFYILRLEDYTRNPLVYIKQIYRFLGMREVTDAEEQEILNLTKSNVRKDSDKKLGGMLNETRDLLKRFYQVFNDDMAAMLSDAKFRWLD